VPALINDMDKYFKSGKTAPALEFLSPIKGPNLENITVQVGSGISTPTAVGQATSPATSAHARRPTRTPPILPDDGVADTALDHALTDRSHRAPLAWPHGTTTRTRTAGAGRQQPA